MPVPVPNIERPLRRLLNRAHGRVTPIEKSLGYPRSYLSRVARGERPADPPRFDEALRQLGVEPRDFYRHALGLDAEGLLEDLPRSEPLPRLCVELRNTARRIERALQQPVEATSSSEQPSEELAERLRAGTLVGRARWLRQELPQNSAAVMAAAAALEDHRHREPWEASRLSQVLAVDLCPRLSGPGVGEAFCAALGVLGSARRSVGDLAVAASVLYIALPFSYRAGLRAEARMMQRVAYVLRDHLRHVEAIQVASEAGALYGKAGDPGGFAETLVDRGLFHYYEGSHQPAVATLRSALKVLPGRLRRHRITALHTLGLISGEDGAAGLAADYLSKAEALLEPDATYERASLLFTRSGIARAAGDQQQAIDLIREARSLAHHPVDRAVATLELMKLLLQAGRRAEALRQRQSLGSLMEALKGHPRAELALLNLCRIDAQALTQDLVSSAKLAVRQERIRF